MELTQTNTKTDPLNLLPETPTQPVSPEGPSVALQLLTQNSTLYPNKVQQIPESHLPLRDIETVIEVACSLKASKITLFGGDPMLSPILQNTLELAHSRAIPTITVKSDLLYLPLHIRQCLKQTQTQLITWFYSTSFKIHTRLTRDESSWNTILTHIETCISEGLDLQVDIPDLGQGEKDIKETRLFLKDLGVKHVSCIKQTNMHQMCALNPMHGFTVRANGDVTCCMHNKAKHFGNLHNHGLHTILYKRPATFTPDTRGKNSTSR